MGQPEVALERSALGRMRRTMYLAVGVSAALFGVLQAGGPDGFVAQIGQLRAPFGEITVIVVILVPAAFAILAPFVPARGMRALVTSAAALFVLIQLLFVPCMTASTLNDNAAPWFQGFGAIPAVLLAVAWAATQWPGAAIRTAGWLFVVGIVLFSGSLYALVLTGHRALGAVTPFGGLAFLAAWALLAWTALRA